MTKPSARYLTSGPDEIRDVSGKALDFLAEAGLSPHPVNYHLGYEYAWGRDDDLGREIQVQAGRGDWSGATLDRLYERLVHELLNHPLDALSGELMGLLGQLLDRVRTTRGGMQGFSEVLQRQLESLRTRPGKDAVQDIVAELMGAAQEAIGMAQGLQEQLSNTQREAESLRNQLDQIKKESELDTLTGAYNRRALERVTNALVAETDAGGPVFSVLVLDIDHFKRFNDTYGHVLGDEVLKRVAHVLRQQVRGSDCVARYGGEEFVILLPETPLAGAIKVAESIRRSVEAIILVRRSTQERLSKVTASLGVSAYLLGEGWTSVLERTDQALYRAKNSGRNRIASAD